VSADDLPHLDVVTRAFQESMRLYPPIWIIERACWKDDVIAGYHNSRPALSMEICPFVTHRHPEFWNTRISSTRIALRRAKCRPTPICLPAVRRRPAPLHRQPSGDAGGARDPVAPKVRLSEADHLQAVRRNRSVYAGMGRIDGCLGATVEAKSAEDARQDHARLQHRQMAADAKALAGAERQVGILGSAGTSLGRKAIRVEDIRVFPELRMAMRDKRADLQSKSRPGLIPGDDIIFQHAAFNNPDRRIETIDS